MQSNEFQYTIDSTESQWIFYFGESQRNSLRRLTKTLNQNLKRYQRHGSVKANTSDKLRMSGVFLYFSALFFVFLNSVTGAGLHFAVQLAHVSADHAQAQQLNSAQQPNGTDNSGPACNRFARKVGD